MEKTYTVHEAAALAGITVRTLHHYDHIGLLCPEVDDGNGYRRYGPQEMARLQSIGADAIMTDVPDKGAQVLTQP